MNAILKPAPTGPYRPVTYHEVTIEPCPGGFGEYQCSALGDAYEDESDLLTDIMSNNDNVIELTDEADLPEQAEDIRGRIRNEPERVFAIIDDRGDVWYVGIVARCA